MLGGDDGVRVGGAVQPEHVRGHCVATNMLVAHVPAKTARAQYIGGMVSSKAESPSICPQEVGAADGDAVSTGQTISKLKKTADGVAVRGCRVDFDAVDLSGHVRCVDLLVLRAAAKLAGGEGAGIFRAADDKRA